MVVCIYSSSAGRWTFKSCPVFIEMEVSDNDQDHLPNDGLFHGPLAKWVLAERRVGKVNGIRDLGPRRRHGQVIGSRTLFDCAEGLQVTYRT
jgi:hypothetical protein